MQGQHLVAQRGFGIVGVFGLQQADLKTALVAGPVGGGIHNAPAAQAGGTAVGGVAPTLQPRGGNADKNLLTAVSSGYPGAGGHLDQALAVVPPVLMERSEEHTSELQSRGHLVCRLLLEKKK